MNPEEMKERKIKVKDLAKKFDKNFRKSMGKNMGFGNWRSNP